MHRAFETDPDVPIQARVGANDRPDVVAPTPPWIKGEAPDLALIERHAFNATVPEFAHRLRLIEALSLEPRHGREANALPLLVYQVQPCPPASSSHCFATASGSLVLETNFETLVRLALRRLSSEYPRRSGHRFLRGDQPC